MVGCLSHLCKLRIKKHVEPEEEGYECGKYIFEDKFPVEPRVAIKIKYHGPDELDNYNGDTTNMMDSVCPERKSPSLTQLTVNKGYFIPTIER